MDCCLDAWANVLDEDRETVNALGHFYMPLHLIRMVPFRMKVSEDQALYAISTLSPNIPFISCET